jgi:hypothetical protein
LFSSVKYFLLIASSVLRTLYWLKTAFRADSRTLLEISVAMMLKGMLTRWISAISMSMMASV